ncbi:MAG TPA: hypothetical protein PK095_13825, partial [Myxococcota bacterium]|nr:hypothetical protein [Myxococcota bacterium]
FVLRDGATLAAEVAPQPGAGQVAWDFVFEPGTTFIEAPVWSVWAARPSRVTDASGTALVEVALDAEPSPGTWAHASGRLQVRGEKVRVTW